MGDKTFLQLILLSLCFLLLILIFVFILSPVMAILCMVILALIFTITMRCSPSFNRVVVNAVYGVKTKLKRKISESAQGNVIEYDETFHPEYELVFTRHGRNSRTLVDKETFVIGRKETCDFVISDPSISKEHCRIVYRKYSHTYYIEDLSSNNGTFLGAKRLEPFSQEKLLENAEITISDRIYCFVKAEYRGG